MSHSCFSFTENYQLQHKRKEQIPFSSVRCEYQNVIEVLPAEFIQNKCNSLNTRISPSAVEWLHTWNRHSQEMQKLPFQSLFSPIAHQVFYFLVYSRTYSITLQQTFSTANRDSAIVQSEFSSIAFCPDAYIIARGRYFIYTAVMCFINRLVLTFWKFVENYCKEKKRKADTSSHMFDFLSCLQIGPHTIAFVWFLWKGDKAF